MPHNMLSHMPKGESLNAIYHSLSFLELKSPQIVETNQLFYLIRGSRDYIVFDFDSQVFQKKVIIDTTFDIPRWSCFVPLINGHILIVGGKARKNTGAKKAAFFLDPVTGYTYMAPSMITGHSSHACLLINDDVYVISGKNENNITATQCEALNLTNLT